MSESPKTKEILKDHKAVTKEGEKVTEEAHSALSSIRDVLAELHRLEIDVAEILQKREDYPWNR